MGDSIKWFEENRERLEAERLEDEKVSKPKAIKREIMPKNCYLCDAGPEVHNLHLPNSHCKSCTYAYPPLPQKGMGLDTKFTMNISSPIEVSFGYIVQEATKNMPVSEKKATYRKLINELTDMMEKA